MSESDTPDLARLARELVVAAERYRVRTARRTSGLGTTELTALGLLHVGGPITPTEIARRLQVTTPSVTELIDRLERVDLVHRRPHATDRRKVLVELTDAGRHIVGDAHDEFGAAVERGAAGLSSGERGAAAAFLHRAAEALDGLG